MEKVFERLGLYDIWTVLFPGIIFIGGLKTLNDYMTGLIQAKDDITNYIVAFGQVKIFYPTSIYGIISFVIISYLCGHILHELSSMAKHIIYKRGKPTELLLEKKNKILDSRQLQSYTPIFLKLNENQKFSEDKFEKRREESRNIFNKMNTELQLRGISSKYVKLNLIYNMCFTMCIAIIFMLVYIFIFVTYEYINEKSAYMRDFFGIVIFLFLSLGVLYHRGRRYYTYWVRNIVIAYGNVLKKND